MSRSQQSGKLSCKPQRVLVCFDELPQSVRLFLPNRRTRFPPERPRKLCMKLCFWLSHCLMPAFQVGYFVTSD